MRFLFPGKCYSAVTETKKDAASYVTCWEECRLTWHQRLEKCLLSLLVVKEYGEISGLEKNINCAFVILARILFLRNGWLQKLTLKCFFFKSAWMEVKVDMINVWVQPLWKLNLVYTIVHLPDTPSLQVKISWSELCPAQYRQFWKILTRWLLFVVRPWLCFARNRKWWKAEALFGVRFVSRCAGN